MKRSLFTKVKYAAMAVPAAAMMLGASQGAQIGINFWGAGYWWYNAAYCGKQVTATAFGIDATNWYTTPEVYNNGAAKNTNGWAVNPASGGNMIIKWDAPYAWSSWIGSVAPDFLNDPPPGDNQVTWGIIGDEYTITVSGLRSLGDYTIQLVGAADSATSLADATLKTNGVVSETLTYTNDPGQLISVAANTGAWYNTVYGTSTVSTVYSTISGNDSITIQGLPRNGTIRSQCAGFIITYPDTVPSNPPLIEANPVPPTGDLYPGGSFTLVARASGPALVYQWRLNGTDILGANSPTLNKTAIVAGDSGNYDVVVTNAFGAVTSSVAAVTVFDLTVPVITLAPVSQTHYVGYPVSFTVTATGGLLAYQWKHNTTTLTGETNTTLTLPSITTNSAGTYTCEVSNPMGTTPASATLTVTVPTGAYESAMAGTKPAIWFRASETGVVPQDTASNSGSLGASGLGAYLGAATHPVAGALAGSSTTGARFTGGRVSVPYNASLNPTTFTIEAWLKPAVANTGGTLTCPLSSMHVADPRSGWLIYQSSTGWNLRTYNQNSTATAVSITGGPAPVAGQLYHVVATWDGTYGRVYVNGVLSATSPETNFVANPDSAFAVGARSDGGFGWSGDADEVALYPTALSDAQILAHYENGTNASRSTPYEDLVATDGAVEYLRLEEAAFSWPTAANVGTLGAAWNGSYVDAGGILGSPQITRGVEGPRPATYPGLESDNVGVGLVNGMITAPVCAPLNVNTLTVAGWVKRSNPSTSSDLSWLCWLGDGAFHMNSDGSLAYHWKGSFWWDTTGLTVPADVWTFVALVVEPSRATFYMSEGTTLKSSVINETHTPLAVTSKVGFGKSDSVRTDRNLIGSLDEMAVYTRSLTQSEINTLFMVGTGAELGLALVPGGEIQDTKPVGALHHGVNMLTSWTNSSSDLIPVVREGVGVFTGNSQVTTPANADFNSTVGTISFWLRAPSPAGAGAEAAMLVDRRTGSGAIIGLADAGSIFVQGAGGGFAQFNTTGIIADDQWHHVAVTYDQSASGSVAVYIDGVLDITQPNTAAWSWPATQQIEIGKSHDGYWRRLIGHMDDFRIYNRVLTVAEIGTIKTSGDLIDEAALKVRYDFGTGTFGKAITWPFGQLLSTPSLSPASWTPTGASPPWYPMLPTNSAMFFRVVP